MASSFWPTVRKFWHSALASTLIAATTVPASALPFFTSPAAQHLLELDHQPTVAEIRAAFPNGKLPEKNPFGRPTQHLQASVLEHGPAVIAAFEKSFPGATFAPLGRDAAFLGDILDSFYQGLGQRRIVRVGASGDSLTGDNQAIVDFLRTLGFDLGHLDKNPPFVMFDQTRFRESSQSRTYLRAIAEACRQRPDCDPAKLLEKFNFINTGPNVDQMYRRNIVDSETFVADFLDGQRAAASPDSGPDRILSIDVPGDLVYTTEYHGKFGPLEKHGNEVTAPPGLMNKKPERLQILADVFEVMRVTTTESFRQRVQEAARALDYEFPLRRVTEKVAAEKIQGRLADIKDPARLRKIRFVRAIRTLKSSWQDPNFKLDAFIESQVAASGNLDPFEARLLGLRIAMEGISVRSRGDGIDARLLDLLATRPIFSREELELVARTLEETTITGFDVKPYTAELRYMPSARYSADLVVRLLRSGLQTRLERLRNSGSDRRAQHSPFVEWCARRMEPLRADKQLASAAALELVTLLYDKENESAIEDVTRTNVLESVFRSLDFNPEAAARLNTAFENSDHLRRDFLKVLHGIYHDSDNIVDANRFALRWRLRNQGIENPTPNDWLNAMIAKWNLRRGSTDPNVRILEEVLFQSANRGNTLDQASARLSTITSAYASGKFSTSELAPLLAKVLATLDPRDSAVKREIANRYGTSVEFRIIWKAAKEELFEQSEKALLQEFGPGLFQRCVLAVKAH